MKKTKFDKRLLGSWKSDARQTFAEWNWGKKATPEKRARFKALFGKLEITYTRNKVISKLAYRGWEQSQSYTVLGADCGSVAIRRFGMLHIKNRSKYDLVNLQLLEALFPEEGVIEHLHFEKDRYWISLGDGRNREFFRKIKKASNR